MWISTQPIDRPRNAWFQWWATREMSFTRWHLISLRSEAKISQLKHREVQSKPVKTIQVIEEQANLFVNKAKTGCDSEQHRKWAPRREIRLHWVQTCQAEWATSVESRYPRHLSPLGGRHCVATVLLCEPFIFLFHWEACRWYDWKGWG